MHKKILIISDIEGSSGCRDYESSAFKTKKWAEACVEMSRDVDAVVRSVYDAGAEKVYIKDFHRTGYNLLPEMIDPRAEILYGYRQGKVPGFGDPPDATGIMMLGMHASSGSGGFLAHTMTSRIKRLTVNGRLMAEIEFFSSALAPYGMSPLFFSGCPVACREAAGAVKDIMTFPIDKKQDKKFDIDPWRAGLAVKAAKSLSNTRTKPYEISGPFKAEIEIRDGAEAAKKMAGAWGFRHEGNVIFLEEKEIASLYYNLIRMCYLNPFVEKILPLGLMLFKLHGLLGRNWVRNEWRKKIKNDR